MRELTYSAAIREGLAQAMDLSDKVIILGQLVDSKAGVFGTTSGLVDVFGTNRVQDFPVAEGLMTSSAIGAALAGMRPVLVHQRLDFMLYSLDAIGNWLSLWRFKSNGLSDVPVTIRAVVGKGWGQGPQHSKSLHAWFTHLPGLRVAMPSTAQDAKGLLLESIFGEVPSIIVEDRSLFSMTDNVPEEPYRVKFGEACVRCTGVDVTVVAIGGMVPASIRAAKTLGFESVSVEVIDPRTLTPLDIDTILNSVRKTRRLLVVDPGWRSAGVSAELISSVCERLGTDLACNPKRVCLPDSHTPMSYSLEKEYYPDENTIVNAVLSMLQVSVGDT